MTYVFVFCAIVGGLVMVLQFVLTLIGLGGEALNIDLPDDVDVAADADLEFNTNADLGDDLGGHASSSWVFGVLSFRTIVAALAFFGLAGLAAQSVGATAINQLIVAIAAGIGAMFAVYWMMRGLKSLKAEGTARIQRAVGKHATVYVTIPAERSGTGKIQVNLQNRTMEYLALTSGHELHPGAKIVVVDVITSDTVEVEPVLESERNDDV